MNDASLFLAGSAPLGCHLSLVRRLGISGEETATDKRHDEADSHVNLDPLSGCFVADQVGNSKCKRLGCLKRVVQKETADN